MNGNRYLANYDTQARLITNIVLSVALAVVTIKTLAPSPEDGLRNSILFFFLPIAGMVWLLHPTYYHLTDTFLGIKRPFSTLKLPYTEILNMRTIEMSELGLTFRLFASGGLFGYLGLYNSSVLGRFFMWCTNKSTLVIIQCKTKIIVISPDDPGKFVQEYTSRSRYPMDPH